MGYAFVLLFWALLAPSAITKSIERDAKRRFNFLEFQRDARRRSSLLATVSDLKLSSQSLRQENSALKEKVNLKEKESEVALDRFRIDYDHLEFADAKPLGRGATAVVLRATVFATQVAVKRVSARTVDEQEDCAKTLMHELETCAPLEHRNVVETIGGCWDDGFKDGVGLDRVAIVFELATRGSLEDYITKGFRRTLPMLMDVALGMSYVSFEARHNPNRKRKETHETLLARARRYGRPPARWTAPQQKDLAHPSRFEARQRSPERSLDREDRRFWYSDRPSIITRFGGRWDTRWGKFRAKRETALTAKGGESNSRDFTCTRVG